MTASIEPKSDQLDAVDLLAGPRTFTIESVAPGTPDQPVNIKLAEFPRVWRPSKSMRRVLVAAWGVNGAEYAGKRLTLFCDPTVVFGGIEVGGTRISHMSGLNATLKVSLLIKRGKSAVFTVAPLTEAATDHPSRGQVPASTTEPTREQIAACTDLAELRTMWHASGPERKAQIEARKAELDTTAPGEGDES